MNLFVPFDDTDRTCRALREACRIATPLDRVFAMAAVIVPAGLPTDVAAGELWKATCRAEVALAHAREYVERVAHAGDDLRCMRVQAHTWVEAALAGAIACDADTILLAEWANMRGRVATLFGVTHRLLRHAPCDVRVLYLVGGHARRMVANPEQAEASLAHTRSVYEKQTAARRLI